MYAFVFMFACVLQEALRKGRTKSWDHCAMVHENWSHALVNRMHLWVERVPSKDNISDSPSRESYKILEDLGAVWKPPLLAKLYTGAECDGFLSSCAA